MIETRDVYAHPRDEAGRITGEGDKIGKWDDLLDQYPKSKWPRWQRCRQNSHYLRSQ
jgi:hypothetical protein